MKKTALLLALAAVASLALAPFVQSGGGYDLSWWTVDSGGATFTAGGLYILGGTSGQPDAALWEGGDYSLTGGFWGGAAVSYPVYLPLVVRG
jgi:hypothetical protein